MVLLVFLLTILDLASAVVMLLGHSGVVRVPLLFAAVYLLAKLAFFRDALSIVDAAAAIYCVFLFFGHASGLTWVFLAYFLYKFSVWVFFAVSD